MCETCERASCSLVDIWSFSKHKSIPAIDILCENRGELLWFSWYCTHRMQPLHDVLMGPLMDHFTREVKNPRKGAFQLKIVKISLIACAQAAFSSYRFSST
jgi:hypothetical protein